MATKTMTAQEYAEFLTSLPELEDNSRSTVADPIGEYLKWSARITSPKAVATLVAWCYTCDRPKSDCACSENGGTY